MLTYAGAKVSDLEDELHALAQGLDDLNRRGSDYYAGTPTLRLRFFN